MAPADPAFVSVEVAWSCAPRRVDSVRLTLPRGSTVADALRDLALQSPSAPDLGTWTTAIWGRAAGADTVLREQDRVELLRPLLVDPKEARRLRYRSQAERDAGSPKRRS